MNTFGDELEQHGPDPLGVIGWVIGGKYRVRSYIGGGGFGEVYEGFNSNLPQQRLVLKFFKDLAFRERFDREAQILCRLDHPNISRVMDYYPDENALVMQYIDGRNTDQILREHGPLETEQFIKVARSVATAVAFAHQQGIAHRDLKPGNILVDKNGHVYLIDFGIAKETTDISRTRTGYAALSVNFAAPERQGGRLDYNPYLSDVYELGITLFNLATNSFPYRNPAAPLLDEWKDSAGKTLAPGLRSILKRATNPDPKKRYQSVEQMASELADIDSVYLSRGYSKIGIAVAAVVVLAVGGYFLYPVVSGENGAADANQQSTPPVATSAGTGTQEPEPSPTTTASVTSVESSSVAHASPVESETPPQSPPTAQSALLGENKPEEITATVPVDRGTLSITVDRPSDIYVDDRLRRRDGTTWQETLPVGTYDVRIQHGTDRRQWLNETLAVAKDRTTSKSFLLPSVASGTLKVTSSPSGSNIRIDGPNPAQGRTPFDASLQPGQYRLSVVSPDGAQKRDSSIKIADGRETIVNFDFGQVSVASPAKPAVPPAITDALQQSTADADTAIRQTISRFQQALQNADLDALKAVWPTMSSKDREAYKASFATTGGMVLSGNITDISVSGADATALLAGTARPKAKGSRSSDVKFEFTLRRNGESWLISRVIAIR